MNLSQKIIKFIKINLTTDNWKKKAIQLAADYPGELELNNKSLNFSLLGIEILNGSHLALLEGYNYARNLKKISAATFNEVSKEKKLVVTIQNIKYIIETTEELYILNEIFVEGCYNVYAPSNLQMTVVDIGMNVACTALHLANRIDISKIYSFEPFTPTYQQALKNISLNQHLADKIIPHNFGLGKADAKLELSFDPENKGRMSVVTSTQRTEVKHDSKKEIIEIKSVVTEFKKIFDADSSNNNFFLKVDCEGAEYEIFDSLDGTDVLKRFNWIVIEWHHKGNSKLIEILRRNGFAVYANNTDNNYVGMIYARR